MLRPRRPARANAISRAIRDRSHIAYVSTYLSAEVEDTPWRARVSGAYIIPDGAGWRRRGRRRFPPGRPWPGSRRSATFGLCSPTSEWGIVPMTLLMLTVGTVVLSRRVGRQIHRLQTHAAYRKYSVCGKVIQVQRSNLVILPVMCTVFFSTVAPAMGERRLLAW